MGGFEKKGHAMSRDQRTEEDIIDGIEAALGAAVQGLEALRELLARGDEEQERVIPGEAVEDEKV